MFRTILAMGIGLCVSLVSAMETGFPFSATLVDPAKGKPLNGSFNLEFTAYDSQTSGAALGAVLKVEDVAVQKGAYSATLDFGEHVFDGSPVWIEVRYQKNAKKPGNFVVAQPRVPIGAVPYAQVASTALRTEAADTATTANFAVESLLASHANTADMATNAANASRAAVADSLSIPINAIAGSASAYVAVQTNSDPSVNGQNLHAAYAAAKALTPNGQPLSADNRATVIVVPGKYYLYEPLTLDAEFVDLIGLTTNRNAQHLYGRSDEDATATLGQTASNVRIENLLIDLPRASGNITPPRLTSPAAYFPESGLANMTAINCEFKNGSAAYSMRVGMDYAGYFENCAAPSEASFGALGQASGTFINCTAGHSSFGSTGSASGSFRNCMAGNFSFGSGGSANGSFTNCIADGYSFGASGAASGGRFYFCIGGSHSFTTNGAPSVIGCVRDGVAYP